MRKNTRTAFVCLIHLPLLVLFLAGVWWSLGWRVEHDSPIMLYLGYLMNEHGMLPYRDFFDMNMPGSYWTYAAIGRMTSYTDWGYRQTDLVLLLAIVGLGVIGLRRFGALVACFGPLVFGLVYLGFGPKIMLQRELLALVPLALSLLAATHDKFPLTLRMGICGFFMACAAAIKPHLLIGFPVLFAYLYIEGQPGPIATKDAARRAILLAAASAAGAALPVAAVLAYLLYQGILADFLDIALNYLPLYGAMTDEHAVLQGMEYWRYWISRMAWIGGFQLQLAAALVVLAAAWISATKRESARRHIALLTGLVAAYAVYPGLSGQFWTYHYLPMLYFCCLALGFVFVPHGKTAGIAAATLTACAVVLTLADPSGVSAFKHAKTNSPKDGRVDAISSYLRKNLKPGDTVQPVDWAAGGVAHAMLRARARAATRYIYHFHFYHHVSSPYIQQLRRDFMREFTESRPRFVVESLLPRPFVTGHDTSADFPEFQAYLEQHYREVDSKPGYVIWELK